MRYCIMLDHTMSSAVDLKTGMVPGTSGINTSRTLG